MKPNGPEPRTVASVSFMITQKMKADLRACGFTDAQIRVMTPIEAHEHLAKGANGGSIEDLKALCRRAAEAKGREAVMAICTRHGVTRFSGRRLDGLEPKQEQELRAEIEALLAEPNGAGEVCRQCGDPVRPGDMLPLNGGGHVHHRCADAYIAARDAPENGPICAHCSKPIAHGEAGQPTDFGDPLHARCYAEWLDS